MLESQIDQHERREVQRNDQLVRRQQGGTFHQHAVADAATPHGRFTQVNAATVVGATAVPQYPAASSAHQIQLPDEPPLGLDNPALEPVASPSAQATGPTSDGDAPPASTGEQRADVGSPSQTGGPPEGPNPSLQGQRGLAGSPSRYRRY